MRIRSRKSRTQKKKRKARKTRSRHSSKPANLLLNLSPISSPGPNSPSFSLSPNTPKTLNTPNTPITKRAKELANLYPNRGTMVKRSSSFNDGMTTEEFYTQFERLFPEKNGPRYV
jgi:hypothetical protein